MLLSLAQALQLSHQELAGLELLLSMLEGLHLVLECLLSLLQKSRGVLEMVP